MGLFARKDKTADVSSIRKPSSLTDDQSHSSQSSLKSPITSGYSRTSHSSILPMVPRIEMPKGPDPHVDPAGYLRSIGAVRERCALVMEKAKKNKLNHFEVDMTKFKDTTSFVVSIIKVGTFPQLHAEFNGISLTKDIYSATLPPTTQASLPMAGGSISMSVAVIALQSCYLLGQVPSTPRNAAGDSSTYSWSRYC
jgi:hypothetical protein